MKLNKLLEGVELTAIKGNRYTEINGIYYDSKQLKPEGLFFAVKGAKLNGVDFIDEAIERGAVCIVCEDDFITYKSVGKVLVKDVRKACATIANNFYKRPSQKLNAIGITGTNGKTTTLCLIQAILKQSGKKCGAIGTISYELGERRIPATNTTPSAIMLQMFMHEMVEAQIPYCVMEVSSHSIHQRRVDGINFKTAIFTNLSREHLDYHKDMQEYFDVKKRLFDMLESNGHAIVNADDEFGKKIVEGVREAAKARVLTYAIAAEADIKAFDIRSTINGSFFKVKHPAGTLELKTPLIGEYNIYNILAAVSFAISEEVGFGYIKEAIASFNGAPGRLQKIDSGQGFSVFVDYAHTDDALMNVLSTLKKVAKSRVITVFGCGGERDRTKRPRMGKVASDLADYVIITSDNPRSEDPKSIIEEIVKGLPKDFKDYKTCTCRKKAIESSIAMAKEEDIILIAGKGHESYQVLKDTVVSFDDRKVAEEALEQGNARPVTNKE
ncbi:MAG: UDP-N-acetylmuramoyl-L-alanyl-D-glutamate--2,6-diaminopimelate ligase [Candidatus Omnitrophica bacterium]|nr:UDP-N-acetylmuramoyl-L-alanyl-D-glutamate--2,6-diaminopimelate ligase [Candidatus Omnitrophota bacterium]